MAIWDSKLKLFLATTTGLTCSILFTVPSRAATLYKVELDQSLFGSLDQGNTDCSHVSCGPTAAVNSFVFLQNQYEHIYGKNLVPNDNLEATANELLSNDFMDTDCFNLGTLFDDFIFGKRKWIESKVPGKTLYAAQSEFAWRGGRSGQDDRKDAPEFFDNVVPKWNFIFTELKGMADIEILLQKESLGGVNHYVTLTSFNWNDEDMDGVIDENETAKIGFIDPLGGIFKERNVKQNSLNSSIFVDYDGIGGFDSRIAVAVKESPISVPEPLTTIGSFIALGFGVLFKRKRN